MFGLPNIDVEQTFNELVREHSGAYIITDVLPQHRAPVNADYAFSSERVVAELKCLTEDNSDSPDRQSKLNAVLDKYLNAGLIKSKDFNESTWPTFPLHLQRDIANIFSPSIRRCVKRADIQIRESKRLLGLSSYSGLLLIANEGFVSMPPAACIEAIQREVESNRPNINGFVYFTGNMFTLHKNSLQPVRYWLPILFRRTPEISDDFIYKLGMNWMQRVSNKMGIPFASRELSDEDTEGFWGARNLPNKNP